MKIAYYKIFDLNNLVKTKDSWGDLCIQVRGDDFPKEIKEFKHSRIIKNLDKTLFSLVFNDDLSDYRKAKSKAKIGYKSLNLDLCKIEKCFIQKKYYDFAINLGHNIYIRKSSTETSPVIFADKKIEDWKALVMPYLSDVVRYEKRR